jgi:hypothetical protein
MDTEEGVEVVWNEVQFSERKNYKLQEVGGAEKLQPGDVRKLVFKKESPGACPGDHGGVRSFLGRDRE